MKLIKQLFFLYKIDSSFIIYKKFLISKVIRLFDKIKKIKFKKEHQKFLIKKKISQDWFSHHAYDFHCQLKKFKNKFHYLIVEDISDNHYIINNLCIKTHPLAVSPTAYFFYNFAYSTFNSNQILIIN